MQAGAAQMKRGFGGLWVRPAGSREMLGALALVVLLAIHGWLDAMSAGGAVSVTSQDVSTKGSGANGILARSQGTGAFGAVTVLANGAISTESSGSSGISASSLHGAVDVTSQAISTLGVGSTAISASSGETLQKASPA